MKKNKLSSLLLALTLLLSILAGCGTNDSAPDTADAASAPSVSAPEPVTEEPATPGPASAEGSVSEESVVDKPVLRESISYPLEEGLTFSVFTSAGGPNGSVDSLDVYPSFQIAEEKTGVKMTYTLSTPEAT